MHKLAGTNDGVVQTGTVNLHFLIPGTSEPISATVSALHNLYCEVPENIHTAPTEGNGNSSGGERVRIGGRQSQRLKYFN